MLRNPKLRSLQSRGASTSELTEILSKVPKIFGKDRSLSVYYDFVKEIIEADKSSKFEKLCHSLPQEGSKQGNKMRNVSVLRELGVPQERLFSLLTCQSNVVCGKEKFGESIKKVVKMGFDPTTSKFVQALKVVHEMSDKAVEERVNVYKRLGFGVEDVWAIFKKYPPVLTFTEEKITNNFETMKRCGLLEDEVRAVVKNFLQCICVSEQKIENSIETFLGLGFSREEFVMMVQRVSSCFGYSAESVKKKTEFLVKNMNWPLQAFVSNPQVFGLSMEKRIVPRCNVIKALMSKRLLGTKLPAMSSVLGLSSTFFRLFLLHFCSIVMYSLILHGRRLLELQKCRNFRFVVNPSAFSNFFSSAADLSLKDGRKGKTFTVSYLVDSLGLTTKLAESILKKVSFENKGNPDSVLKLLRSHGFTDSQISSIITAYPRLLVADAEKSVGPKLKFLQSRGASSSELTEILSKVPKIFGIKKDKAISVYYDFVKEIIEADKSNNYEKVFHSLPQEGSAQENKMRNVLVLRELGVPQRLLFHLLTSNFQPVCGKEKFQESLKKVLEMGFDPTTPNFVDALTVVYGFSEKTIEERFNVYKRLGFEVRDVWEMFKKWPITLKLSENMITRMFESLKKCGLLEDEVCTVLKKFPPCIGYSEHNITNTIETFLVIGFSRDEFLIMVKRFPPCIGYSAEAVKKKTEFLVKTMNWSLKAVVSNPAVIGYSLEKRTVPRCNVIKALVSKGLLGSELPKMSSVLVCTDEVFLNRFVRKHDDKELVAELMAIFTPGKEEKNR
ncbi:hypothetical protein AALP_AA2G016300 [Arabis alpina]|uniref:Mitochondrial transcription termination factor family protein n=1 Tax=Arabis alpina TaxID=50452 RepID=A0A087HEP5_ARAAL|nr:hypothetical protein AALP_AA2G016300 [Arabis alpina]